MFFSGARPSISMQHSAVRRENSRKRVDFPIRRLPRQATNEEVCFRHSDSRSSRKSFLPMNFRIITPFHCMEYIRSSAFRQHETGANLEFSKSAPVFTSWAACGWTAAWVTRTDSGTDYLMMIIVGRLTAFMWISEKRNCAGLAPLKPLTVNPTATSLPNIPCGTVQL